MYIANIHVSCLESSSGLYICTRTCPLLAYESVVILPLLSLGWPRDLA